MRYISNLQLIDPTNLPKAKDSFVQTALTDAFILLGAISVLMLVIAGVRYVFSRGNADATAQAKNMIAYSLMGLVIAALAATIVSFVLGRAG